MSSLRHQPRILPEVSLPLGRVSAGAKDGDMNGVMVAEWPTLPLQRNSSTLLIGSAFQGILDDVTVFSRELTGGEVQVLAAP